MADLSILAHRLYDNTKVLEAFDKAIRHFKQQKIVTKDDVEFVNYMIAVMKPLLVILDDGLSDACTFSVDSVARIIRLKQGSNWQQYRILLQELVQKIDSMDYSFLVEDFQILDDVGDALDTECANLFRRMGNR